MIRRPRHEFRLLIWLILAVLAAQQPAALAKERIVETQEQRLTDRGVPQNLYVIPPEATDARIVHNDRNNIVYFNANGSANANLLVFIGGGHNLTNDPPYPFWLEAIRLGYRVIGLDFRYDPPANQSCNRSPDDACFEKQRALKVFGAGSMPGVEVAPPEAIVNRLTQLLRYLAQTHPQDGWAGYMDGDRPKWDRIALSGFSQGSGLAAFLAKRVKVARVILVSSPWDHFPAKKRLADWLAQPSATPLDRWYGIYSAYEPVADWLGRAYAALGVPADHIHVLSMAPRKPAAAKKGTMPYHWSVIGREYTPLREDGSYAYEPEWGRVLGSGAS